MKTNERTVILTLYPNSVGIAYVVSRNPRAIYGYGLRKVKPFEQQKFMKIVKTFFTDAKPTIIILLDYDHSPISERVKTSIFDIETLARAMNLQVLKYSRRQIKDTFESFGAKTKFNIAMLLIKWYPELEAIRPYKRILYEPEDYHIGVFDAFALMITYEHLR